ncbi:MAG TPA: cytochrome c [Actinomycetota bacterium]
MSERGSAKVWIIAFVGVAAAGLGGLIGIGCAIGANACPFGDDGGITSTAGSDIYVEAACIGCHGGLGEGTGRGPSLIGGSVTERTFASLVDVIGRGSPPMPRYKGFLTPEQIQAVARYVQKLQEAGP